MTRRNRRQDAGITCGRHARQFGEAAARRHVEEKYLLHYYSGYELAQRLVADIPAVWRGTCASAYQRKFRRLRGGKGR